MKEPQPKAVENMGMFLFVATFTLCNKDKSVEIQEKIQLLARDGNHFVTMYGYQKKLNFATNLANKGNYKLIIEIEQVS
jgi:hypothetical protein